MQSSPPLTSKLENKLFQNVCVCVCVCERERERESINSILSPIPQKLKDKLLCENRGKYLQFGFMNSQIRTVIHGYYILLLPRKLLLI
jgi:hypothetical protein